MNRLFRSFTFIAFISLCFLGCFDQTGSKAEDKTPQPVSIKYPESVTPDKATVVSSEGDVPVNDFSSPHTKDDSASFFLTAMSGGKPFALTISTSQDDSLQFNGLETAVTLLFFRMGLFTTPTYLRHDLKTFLKEQKSVRELGEAIEKALDKSADALAHPPGDLEEKISATGQEVQDALKEYAKGGK